MLAKVAVLGLPVLTVVVAAIVGYINGHPIWAPFAVSVCLIPPVLGLIFVLRLVGSKQREREFIFGQVVWGAVPGHILMVSALVLLQRIMMAGLYAKEYMKTYNIVKREGDNILRLSSEQNTKIRDHLMASTTAILAVKEMILYSFVQAVVAETAKFLMGHRVQNLLNNDDVPTVELVIVSFCAPVVGSIMTLAALFGIFTAAMSKPVYNILFSFLARFLVHCALEVGTACYMGLAASKRYVLRTNDNWLSTLTIAVLLSFAVHLAEEVQKEPGTVLSGYINSGWNISSRTARFVYWVTSRQLLDTTVLFCCFIAIFLLCVTSYIRLTPFMNRRRRSNLIEK